MAGGSGGMEATEAATDGSGIDLPGALLEPSGLGFGVLLLAARLGFLGLRQAPLLGLEALLALQPFGFHAGLSTVGVL